MKIKCLIIDDEQLARDVLEKYASNFYFLEVIGKCKNALSAGKILKEKTVDLLFLDVQMPGISGVDFLRNMSQPPKVIFTTAFSNYALEGFELEAMDYLLKPIGLERFSNAMQRVKSHFNKEKKLQTIHEGEKFEEKYIMVKEGHDMHKLFLKDILFIEAMREYVSYCTRHGKIMELKAISKVEKILPQEYFIRTHRSFIVAKSEVQKRQRSSVVLENGREIPMGKTFKKKVLAELF